MASQNTGSFQKIYLNDNNIVTLQCPACKASKEADISKYIKLETSVRLKVKCACGNSHAVVLERRKLFRKNTNIHGTFIYSVTNEQRKKGPMTVLDISRGGMKIKALGLPTVKKGDALELEFYLNNNTQTLIKKQVIVRNVKGYIINTEFSSFDADGFEDKDIAFYLF